MSQELEISVKNTFIHFTEKLHPMPRSTTAPALAAFLGSAAKGAEQFETSTDASQRDEDTVDDATDAEATDHSGTTPEQRTPLMISEVVPLPAPALLLEPPLLLLPMPTGPVPTGPVLPCAPYVTAVAGCAAMSKAKEAEPNASSPIHRVMPMPSAPPSADVTLQKSINKDLSAAGQRSAAQLLEVVEEHLGEMNGINLSTAFHRLARCREGKHFAESRTFGAMLAMAERKAMAAMVEMRNGQENGSLPANCCTIIAWSCASLKIFRVSLFSLLVKIAAKNSHFCKTYEITNLLWACAQFQKQRPDLPASEVSDLVSHSAAIHFAPHQLGVMKASVLVSGFVSIFSLAEMNTNDLLVNMKEVLLRRSHELAPSQLAQIARFLGPKGAKQ